MSFPILFGAIGKLTSSIPPDSAPICKDLTGKTYPAAQAEQNFLALNDSVNLKSGFAKQPETIDLALQSDKMSAFYGQPALRVDVYVNNESYATVFPGADEFVSASKLVEELKAGIQEALDGYRDPEIQARLDKDRKKPRAKAR